MQGIVRGHKGAIRVESSPGAGSAFTLVLPASGSKVATPAGPEALAARGRGTVLVVDDEPLVLRTTKAALERRGYEVITAIGGPAAIEVARGDGPIDLVVLDLSMPGMNGQEALAALRRDRPGLRVVISSGYSEAECRELFRHDWISGFIQKPYTAARLAESVKAALAEAEQAGAAS